jgi:hypothetical protein
MEERVRDRFAFSKTLPLKVPSQKLLSCHHSLDHFEQRCLVSPEVQGIEGCHFLSSGIQGA